MALKRSEEYLKSESTVASTMDAMPLLLEQALRKLVATMEAKGQDIRNKSELLTSMLKTIEIASVFRGEAAETLNAETAEETARLRKG